MFTANFFMPNTVLSMLLVCGKGIILFVRPYNEQ